MPPRAKRRRSEAFEEDFSTLWNYETESVILESLTHFPLKGGASTLLSIMNAYVSLRKHLESSEGNHLRYLLPLLSLKAVRSRIGLWFNIDQIIGEYYEDAVSKPFAVPSSFFTIDMTSQSQHDASPLQTLGSDASSPSAVAQQGATTIRPRSTRASVSLK
eukprot:ANDGO_03317.mRNA.1 hypothetical protein